MSYEGSDNGEEFKKFPIFNNNNSVNVVSDSNSDGNIKNDNKNTFDEDVNNISKITTKTLLMKMSTTKWKQPHKSLSMQKWSVQ